MNILHLVASKWRWDDCQRQRTPQEEKAWKESQGLEENDKRKWCAVYEDAAKKMLKYLEDSEDLKVGLGELKEQLEPPEEAGISIVQIAKSSSSRQEENEVYIASLARWETQLKGLVELERRCRELMQEVELLIERQEVLAGLVEDKSRLQSKATEKCYETIFEEMMELEEKKSKEALVLVQKKAHLVTMSK